MTESELGELLTPEQVAQRLSVKVRRLTYWRAKKEGPPYLRVGAAVRYPVSAFEAWIQRQTQGGPKPRKRQPPPSEEGFEEFYEAYPRKAAVGDARKAWRQTAGVRPPLAEVLAALQRWGPYWKGRRRQYTPLAATWLRPHRWADPPPPRGPLPRHEFELARDNAAITAGQP